MAIGDLISFVEQLNGDVAAGVPEYVAGIHRKVRTCAAPEFAGVETQAIEDARKTIADAMDDYMDIENPAHMLLIPAPPGIGKTWAGVDFAHRLHDKSGHRIMYAGPRHNFFPDILTASKDQKRNPDQWYEWLPRQEDDDSAALHTCNHAGPINTWLGRGFSGMDFCSKICGWDYINKGCPYHKQKKRAHPLIYAQHAHVVLGHPMMDEFQVIIGDESPMGTFIWEWKIPTRWILPRDMDLTDPLASVLNDISKIAERGERVHGSTLMKQLGAQRVVDACEGFTMPAGAAVLPPTIRNADDVEDVGYNYLPELVPKLLMEAMATLAGTESVNRLWVDENGLLIETRRHLNEQTPSHIIWFDATGKPGLYEQMFGRPVEVVDVRPRITGSIHQITSRANGKGTLVDQDGGATEGMAQLKTQIDLIAAKHGKPAIVTYQALEEMFDQRSTHFYGSRGTNDFQDCDCLIVAGTPQPPLYQIEKAAKCLWHNRWRPFDTEWYAQYRPYNYIDADGQGREYPTSQYGDPELNEILWQYREAEIIQSAHRARILFRDVPVYLLTNIPIDELPPTQLMSIADLMDAPNGVNPFSWRAAMDWCDTQDVIAISDMMLALDIHRATANKYMDAMESSGAWERAIVKTGQRGRPPRCIKAAND